MTIERRIAAYTPPPKTIELLHSTKVVLLVGISGAGKDTIKKRLLVSADFSEMVSHTTRLPRENDGVTEQDGVDYHFVDEPAVAAMLEHGDFIEAKFVHGTVYGTSAAELQKTHDQQKIAITISMFRVWQNIKSSHPLWWQFLSCHPTTIPGAGVLRAVTEPMLNFKPNGQNEKPAL